MQDDLLLYYERELTYLRRLGAEFATAYPKVASRLQLEPTKCEDPHVERLLEGFAFLAARVHRRLDDDLPEVSEAMLEVLHPQHVRPIPALSLVELELDPERGALPAGVHVPRGTELRSARVHGVACRFRTSYDVTLWPATLEGVTWAGPDALGPGARVGEAVGALRLQLRALVGLRLGQLVAPGRTAGDAGPGLDTLRLHLAGEGNVTDTLHELLLNSCLAVVVRDPDQPSRAPVVLPPTTVRPVGFEPEDALLPYPTRTFGGRTLLQELFAFPQKFRFVDLVGVGDALRALEAGPRAEVVLAIAPFERAERRQVLELGVSPQAVRLGCTPIVNLFTQVGEPILLTERQPEYQVVPDARHRLELETWSVDAVAGVVPGAGDSHAIAPLYGFRHGRESGSGVYWHAVRRASGWRTDRGTDVYLSFADLRGQLRVPDAEVVTLRLTCFNGDLPSRLPLGVDARGDLELAQGGPVRRVTCLVRPTPVVQPPLGRALLWRLISTLSLNHLSLVSEGREALRELLRLHNAGDAAAAARMIEGLVDVRSAPTYARVAADAGLAFARGVRVELDFDEEHFPGGGMFLFASVLERFLAMHATLNGFTQLVARSRQRRRPVREWAPRAGTRTLL